MSAFPDLQERLAESERRIETVIQHLETHHQLEVSLRNAGKGLQETNKEVEHLVASTTVAIESLAAVLVAFRDVTEILKRIEPDRATEAVAKLEDRVRKLQKASKDEFSHLASEISVGQEKIEQQLAAEGKSIRKYVPKVVIYVTLLLAIASLFV